MQCTFTLLLLTHLGELCSSSFEQNWIPNGCFLLSLPKICLVIFEKSKCKTLHTDRQTDYGQQVIRIVNLSLQLRWAKNIGNVVKSNASDIAAQSIEREIPNSKSTTIHKSIVLKGYVLNNNIKKPRHMTVSKQCFYLFVLSNDFIYFF
jgi:hypothetical protein